MGRSRADLQMVGGAPLGASRDLDRDDEIASAEYVVALGGVALQTMEIGERDRSLARRPAHDHRRVQGGKRHRNIRWVRGNAGFRPAEDRVIAVETVEGRAAGARPPLVAGKIILVAEVSAAGALHDV